MGGDIKETRLAIENCSSWVLNTWGFIILSTSVYIENSL